MKLNRLVIFSVAWICAIMISSSLTTSALAGAHATSGTVLITGSNRGIGLELARAYAEKGWTVIATARKPDKADDLKALAAANDNVRIEQLDVTDPDMIQALADKLKDQPIDVLLNNAAILGEPADQMFGDFDYDLMNLVMAVNVEGPLRLSEAFVEHVAKSDQKKIVAITSTQGSIQLVRNGTLAFYNTSKAALNMSMRVVSKDLAARGITVALISPGAVDTDMMNLALSGANTSMPLLTPQQSAEAVIDAIDNYTFEMSGSFMSHRQTEIPW